jgi:hypothetical protein
MTLTSRYQGSMSAATRLAETNNGGRDLIDQTLIVWQPRAKRQLTREDGREIVENITGFFRILQEWDRLERATTEIEKQDS